MASAIHRQRNELQAYLLELVNGCPLDLCNPEDCPLFTVRKMAEQERSCWFDALDEKDLASLATYHYACLEKKMEAQLAELGGLKCA